MFYAAWHQVSIEHAQYRNTLLLRGLLLLLGGSLTGGFCPVSITNSITLTLLFGLALGGGGLTLPANLLETGQVRLGLLRLASGGSLGGALLSGLLGGLLTNGSAKFSRPYPPLSSARAAVLPGVEELVVAVVLLRVVLAGSELLGLLLRGLLGLLLLERLALGASHVLLVRLVGGDRVAELQIDGRHRRCELGIDLVLLGRLFLGRLLLRRRLDGLLEAGVEVT